MSSRNTLRVSPIFTSRRGTRYYIGFYLLFSNPVLIPNLSRTCPVLVRSPRGGYILVNNSSVVNSILAKANHFFPRSFFRHLISQFAMTYLYLPGLRSQFVILKVLPLLYMSFFFAMACDYITMLTIRPGTTMIFLGVLPARYLDVSSCARTSFSTSSFGVSFGHSSVKRTLPLN